MGRWAFREDVIEALEECKNDYTGDERDCYYAMHFLLRKMAREGWPSSG
jgi:hypothetical protein